MNSIGTRAGGSVFGPALLLGIGLGGFVDGIVLHQLLRWHHLLSARPEADQTANLVADGVFHAVTWLAVLAGLLWLWRRTAAATEHRTGQRRWGVLAGPMLAGWGLFNLVEGAVNHRLLGLHHVRPGPGAVRHRLPGSGCAPDRRRSGLVRIRQPTHHPLRTVAPRVGQVVR